MLKKLLTLGVVAAVVAVISGCSALETAQNFNGQDITTSGDQIAHISATTHGLYLLWIPLITGSTTNIGMPAINEDSVSPTSLCNMVTAKAKAMGAKRVVDVVTTGSSANIMYVFSYKVASASGNAIK